jgi:hypothetical protein
MQLYREFPVKQCREVRFSNGGHLFAAVNGTTINVYDTYTTDTVATLRGHSGAPPMTPIIHIDAPAWCYRTVIMCMRPPCIHLPHFTQASPCRQSCITMLEPRWNQAHLSRA